MKLMFLLAVIPALINAQAVDKARVRDAWTAYNEAMASKRSAMAEAGISGPKKMMPGPETPKSLAEVISKAEASRSRQITEVNSQIMRARNAGEVAQVEDLGRRLVQLYVDDNPPWPQIAPVDEPIGKSAVGSPGSSLRILQKLGSDSALVMWHYRTSSPNVVRTSTGDQIRGYNSTPMEQMLFLSGVPLAGLVDGEAVPDVLLEVRGEHTYSATDGGPRTVRALAPVSLSTAHVLPP